MQLNWKNKKLDREQQEKKINWQRKRFAFNLRYIEKMSVDEL